MRRREFITLLGGTSGHLRAEATPMNFVRDAYDHLKVIGYSPTATPMLVKAGMDANPDNDPGLISFGKSSVDDFLSRAAGGRVWLREPINFPRYRVDPGLRRAAVEGRSNLV